MLVANEGTLIAFVPRDDAEKSLKILRDKCGWRAAAIIGNVRDDTRPLVTLRTVSGVERIITMPSGEQLPRIC